MYEIKGFFFPLRKKVREKKEVEPDRHGGRENSVGGERERHRDKDRHGDRAGLGGKRKKRVRKDGESN